MESNWQAACETYVAGRDAPRATMADKPSEWFARPLGLLHGIWTVTATPGPGDGTLP